MWGTIRCTQIHPMPEIKADGFVYSTFSPGWITVGVFLVVSQRSGLRSSSQAHAMCCTLMCLPFSLFHCLSFTSARGVAILSKGQMPRPSPFRLLSRDCLVSSNTTSYSISNKIHSLLCHLCEMSERPNTRPQEFSPSPPLPFPGGF